MIRQYGSPVLTVRTSDTAPMVGIYSHPEFSSDLNKDDVVKLIGQLNAWVEAREVADRYSQLMGDNHEG